MLQRVDTKKSMLYNKSMIIASMVEIMRNLKPARLLAVGLLLAGVLSLVLVPSPEASAACDMNRMSIESGADCARGNGQPTELIGDTGVFNRITSILLFIVGAVAVVMLIFGGIRYVVSGGDQNSVTAAKNTILYAIIGVIVAMLAYAAVSFITDAISRGTN